MQIKHTMRLTLLFAMLIATLGTLGYAFGGAGGLLLGLLFAGAMNLGTYWYSDKVVLKMYRAQPLEEAQHPGIHATVEALAKKADVPKPNLYITQQQAPNAFATGRNPDHSAVCVTSGLLQHLSQDEVEGVLAHEIAHITNRDTLIQAVAGTMAGAVSMIAQMLWFSSLSRQNRNPALMFGGMLLAPLAAMVLKAAVSRNREYVADATAAQHTDPSYLASALNTLEQAAQQMPMDGAKGTSHMFIVNPFRGDTLSKLFASHPPTEKRIERLQQQA